MVKMLCCSECPVDVGLQRVQSSKTDRELLTVKLVHESMNVMFSGAKALVVVVVTLLWFKILRRDSAEYSMVGVS